MRITLVTLLFIVTSLSSWAQRRVGNEVISTPMVGIHYTSIFPAGDLKNRYGYLNQLGLTAGYKDKSNLVYGIEGNFYFGNRVKNDSIFDFLKDNLGNIAEAEGQFAVVQVLSRGFNIHAHIGKIIPIFGSNPNSGLYISFGAGYSLFKYRIQTTYDFVPLLEADNRKNYDRQTIGFSLNQFIGYSLINASRPIHFYIGLYANQGFSTFTRSWFYDQGPAPQGLMYDNQWGIRSGWYIPIYKRKAKTIYFD
jgi:hypothetical protein